MAIHYTRRGLGNQKLFFHQMEYSFEFQIQKQTTFDRNTYTKHDGRVMGLVTFHNALAL
jgi:hypothetical protein